MKDRVDYVRGMASGHLYVLPDRLRWEEHGILFTRDGEILISQITGVVASPRVGKMKALVVTVGGGAIERFNLAGHEADRLAVGLAAMIRPSAQPPTPSSLGLADELERLSDLHDLGHLTTIEFAAAKARLLGLRDEVTAAPEQPMERQWDSPTEPEHVVIETADERAVPSTAAQATQVANSTPSPETTTIALIVVTLFLMAVWSMCIAT